VSEHTEIILIEEKVSLSRRKKLEGKQWQERSKPEDSEIPTFLSEEFEPH